MRKNSIARIKANNKYNKKAYKQFNVKLKPFQMKILENYCSTYGNSKNKFAILALKEKMERDTGKSFDEFLKESQEGQKSIDNNAIRNIEPSEAKHIKED